MGKVRLQLCIVGFAKTETHVENCQSPYHLDTHTGTPKTYLRRLSHSYFISSDWHTRISIAMDQKPSNKCSDVILASEILESLFQTIHGLQQDLKNMSETSAQSAQDSGTPHKIPYSQMVMISRQLWTIALHSSSLAHKLLLPDHADPCHKQLITLYEAANSKI